MAKIKNLARETGWSDGYWSGTDKNPYAEGSDDWYEYDAGFELGQDERLEIELDRQQDEEEWYHNFGRDV